MRRQAQIWHKYKIKTEGQGERQKEPQRHPYTNINTNTNPKPKTNTQYLSRSSCHMRRYGPSHVVRSTRQDKDKHLL